MIKPILQVKKLRQGALGTALSPSSALSNFILTKAFTSRHYYSFHLTDIKSETLG